VRHEPVLVEEMLEHLEPGRGGTFVDCTVGLGGHSRALLDRGASRVIGFDRDRTALEAARAALAPFADRVVLVHRDYRELDAELDRQGVGQVDGILADLGVSSMQLDEPGRGFSFRRDEPLDMRMDASTGETAAELLGRVDERALADVIFKFGEERHARRIARAIVTARERGPLDTTGRLADVVRRAVPRRGHSRIDPATRTFQAIRIWVNGELEGLEAFLGRAARRLAPGGRMVVISFHSLEDRAVKHTLRALQESPDLGLTIRTRRPVVPGDDETERNPRARSAKLRAAGRDGHAA
jgi:16S rRNA (cytosine1402-N4)-methyltransferase